MTNELSQLIFIEAYLFGLVCLLPVLLARRFVPVSGRLPGKQQRTLQAAFA